MKPHILAALREQFDRWEKLLSNLSEEQVTTPYPSSTWSVKDVIAHLMAWQKRSIARMDLMDSSRYSWLAGYSLADVLLGSYDHHQEHYEALLAALPAASA
jgi:hypothetical protein